MTQRRLLAGLLLVVGLGGCSTVMEANRPDPVNLSKYAVGEPRMDVIAHLGAPANSVQNDGQSCDIYRLYTRGVSKVGKGAIILGEAAADVFTLGLAEVVATPGEAVTKNKQHTVLFCYSPGGQLSSVADEGTVVVGSNPSMGGAMAPNTAITGSTAGTTAPAIPR